MGEDRHGGQTDPDLDEDKDHGVEDLRADVGHPARSHGAGGGHAQQAHAAGHDEGGQASGADGVTHPQGVENRSTSPGGHHGAGRHHEREPQAHGAQRRRRQQSQQWQGGNVTGHHTVGREDSPRADAEAGTNEPGAGPDEQGRYPADLKQNQAGYGDESAPGQGVVQDRDPAGPHEDGSDHHQEAQQRQGACGAVGQ